jgi:diguanylate cyclase (GGDEF)-like protein
MQTSLRTQLAAAFGVLVLALAAVLTVQMSAEHARETLAERGDTLQTLARSVSSALADGLAERLREVQHMADHRAGVDVDPLAVEAWSAEVAQIQALRPQYSWVGVTDASGTVLAATGGMMVGEVLASRPGFRTALQRPHVGDVHAARLLEALLPADEHGDPLRFVDFAAPLRDSQGRVRGVLLAHANWNWAQEVIGHLFSPDSKDRGVRVFILDRKGQVIHRPRDVGADEHPLRLAQLPVGGGADWAWSDGRRYLTAAARLPARRAETDLGWLVVTRQPMQEVRSADAVGRRSIVLTGLLAALAAVGVALWLAHRISHPLAAIAAAARRVRAGDLHTPMPPGGNTRELRLLAQAIGDMKAALLEREAVLEQRVAERTAELAQAHGELARANEELRALAHHDALTGLHNRRWLEARLHDELARQRRTRKPMALLLLDVDHFKRVNDTLGHAGGDAVLKGVARCLQQGCRGTDALARFGGEEFVVLLPETPLEGALALAEKLRGAVARAAGLPLPVSISIGMAMARVGDGRSADALLQAADGALYAAKAAGRNRVVCEAAPMGAVAAA